MKDARVLALEIVYDLMRIDPGIDMTKETFLVIARDPHLGANIRKACDVAERHILADRKGRKR